MSVQSSSQFELAFDVKAFDPTRAYGIALGAATPLWLPFAAAISTGLAFWSISQWAQFASLPVKAGQETAQRLSASLAPFAKIIAASETLEDTVSQEVVVQAAKLVTTEIEALTEPLAPSLAQPLDAASPEPLADPLAGSHAHDIPQEPVLTTDQEVKAIDPQLEPTKAPDPASPSSPRRPNRSKARSRV